MSYPNSSVEEDQPSTVIIPTQRFSRLRQTTNDWLNHNQTLLSNAGSMMGTTIVTSGLGFIYWWLAAKLFDPSAVGQASASISIMMLLGQLGLVGLNTMLIGEIPRFPNKAGGLLMAGMIVVVTISTLLGLSFTLLAPFLSSDLALLSGGLVNMTIFTLGVTLTSVVYLFDQAIIGMLRGKLQLWRNIFFAASKLIFLLPVGLFLNQSSNSSGIDIYATWLTANLLSLVLLVWWWQKTTQGRNWKFLRPEWSLLRGQKLMAFRHHLVNISLVITVQVLPVIITTLFSAKVTASFYISWLISSFLYAGVNSLTTTLYAVGAGKPALLAQKLRTSLKLSLVAVTLGSVVLVFGADLILGLYGPTYVDNAAWCLRIMSLATFPLIIKAHYLTICQALRQMSSASWIMIFGSILELVLATVGGFMGSLTWLALGWLLAVCIEVLFMTPLVYRTLRPRITTGAKDKDKDDETSDQSGERSTIGEQPIGDPDHAALPQAQPIIYHLAEPNSRPHPTYPAWRYWLLTLLLLLLGSSLGGLFIVPGLQIFLSPLSTILMIIVLLVIEISSGLKNKWLRQLRIFLKKSTIPLLIFFIIGVVLKTIEVLARPA